MESPLYSLMVTLPGLEPATSPVTPVEQGRSIPLELQRRHDLHDRLRRRRGEYLLLLDFDCAGGGRPTFFAAIGQIAQVRIF
jgi:hypothetical protein